MHAVILGITWGLLGLDVGWRPLSGGGVEYIVQIAPHELEVFKQNGIEGDVPPQLRDIRVYRVVVGNDILPRQDPPKQTPASPKPSGSPSWPDTASNPPAQTKSAYNPFASLSSLVSRYPFGQATSDSTKAVQPKESPRSKTAGLDRWSGDTQSKVERPASREPAKETKELPKETPKPWLPFTLVVLALFGSLGGNMYMGWITWETRARYHALVRRRKKRGDHPWRETGYETEAEEE